MADEETMLPEISVPSTPDPEPTVQPQQGIYLNTPPAPINTGISIPPPTQPTALPSPDVAEKRAERAEYGTGDLLKKDKAGFYSDFMSGLSQGVRTQAAATIDKNKEQERNQRILDFASSTGGVLDWNSFKWASDPFTPTDPTSVLEKSYATKFIKETVPASARMDAPMLPELMREAPQALATAEDVGSDLMTKKQYALGVIEDLSKEIEQQGTLPWLADQAKSLTQIYPEAKLRGNVEGVGTLDGLLGDNLKEQADTLRMQDFKSFSNNFMKVINNIKKDNPTLALQFAKEVYGVSNEERRLNNAFTALAIPDFIAGAKLTLNLTRAASLNMRANSLIKNMIEESSKEGPTKALAAEGAGDLAEGAVQRVADNAVKGDPDPVKTVTNVLPDTLNLTKGMTDDIASVGEQTGISSREHVVRIQDRLASNTNWLQSVIDRTARVTRTPLALTVESAVREMKDAVKDLYPGVKNSILNISDPFRHPSSNTWWAEMHFGNWDGSLFTTPETAKGFAKLNGFPDAQIVADTGALTPKGYQKAFDRSAHLDNLIARNNEAMVNRGRELLTDKTRTKEQKALLREEIKGLRDFRDGYQKELDQIKINMERMVSPDNTDIRQQGLGYKIVVTKPMRETEGAFRNYALRLKPLEPGENPITNANKDAVSSAYDPNSARSWRNALLGKLRGADDTLSLMETINRKTATYAKKAFQDVADEIGKDIEQIVTGKLKTDRVTGDPMSWYQRIPVNFINKTTLKSKEMFEQFNDVLKYSQSAKDPITKQEGYYFKHLGELEDHYQRTFDRFPTFAEKQAYFSHVQLQEYGRVLSEISEFRYRARLGVEQHSITLLNAAGKSVSSPHIDGVQRKTLPRTDDSVLIVGGRLGEERLETLNKLAGPAWTKYSNGIQTGEWKLVDIYNSDYAPLKSMFPITGNEDVRYVLAKNVDTKPLDYNHVVRRGGGHIVYDYDNYIKQARIVPTSVVDAAKDRRTFHNNYYGDTTVMPIKSRAEGERIITMMEEARKLIRDGKNGEAKAYLTRMEFPIEWKEWRARFNEQTIDGVKQRAIYDVNEPFRVVPKNRLIYDLDKSLENSYPGTFKDMTKSGNLASQWKVAYNTERDAEVVKAITDTGTQAKPIWGYEPAEKVDPVPTMNRSLDRMINSIFMDDYKISAVEHWLKEAEPWLKESESSIKSSPFYHFHTITSKDAFKSAAPENVISNLLSNKYKIDQFLGIPDKFDTWVNGVTNALLDSAYTRYGSETGRTMLQKAITIPPAWALSKIKDPISLMRGFTFNAKLGLFAIPQIITQLQTYSSILALEPRNGLAGTYGAFLHTWLRVNQTPEFVNALDNMATKINFGGKKWKAGEFKEAWETLKDTGFEKVAGEFVAQDSVKHKAIGDSLGNFFRAGQIPFHEGERGVRLGAWYTAFRRFRESNPTGVITNEIKQKLIDDADLLSNNMSRASNSMLHGGVLSLTTQFLSYQLRLAELFWGKRLGETLAERNMARARMVAVYSAMYGVPGALGLSGFPFGDDLRKEAIDRGYIPGANAFSTTMLEGVLATTYAMASGGGDMKKGDFLSWGPSKGVQGFTQMQDVFHGDKSMLMLLGGASVSTFANTLTAGDGFMRAMASMIRQDNSEMTYKMTPAVFANVFKEISSFNSAWRYIVALNTGKWVSKTDSYIADTTSGKTLMMTMLGVNPQEQNDMYLKGLIVKDQQAAQKWALKKFTEDFHRSLAEDSRNPELAKTYKTNAFAYLYATGYPPEKIASAISQAVKSSSNKIDSSNYSYAFNNVPTKGRSFFGLFDTDSKRDLRREQFKQELQMNEARKAQ